MVRILGFALFAFCAASALSYLLTYNEGGAQLAAAEPAATTAESRVTAFTATGTLVYHRNGTDALVPYVVYQTSTTTVAAKALIFAENSVCTAEEGTLPCPLIAQELIAYYGQHFVTVTGRQYLEHVLVARIAPAL